MPAGLSPRAVILLPVLGLLSACSLFGGSPVAEGCARSGYPDWATSPYVLPYPVGEEYRVGLSSCGGSYHSEGLPDAFAVDFDMPSGSLVTAARSGVVVALQNEAYAYGGGAGNYVWIYHEEDNSFAGYYHFQRHGVQVAPGDSVEAGTPLGLSGASGLAGYPHLHFVVTEGSFAWPYTSVPVTFRNTEPNLRGPTSGHHYRALPY